MLAGDGHDAAEQRRLLERDDDRGHLDGLRSGSEDWHDAVQGCSRKTRMVVEKTAGQLQSASGRAITRTAH